MYTEFSPKGRRGILCTSASVDDNNENDDAVDIDVDDAKATFSRAYV